MFFLDAFGQADSQAASADTWASSALDVDQKGCEYGKPLCQSSSGVYIAIHVVDSKSICRPLSVLTIPDAGIVSPHLCVTMNRQSTLTRQCWIHWCFNYSYMICSLVKHEYVHADATLGVDPQGLKRDRKHSPCGTSRISCHRSGSSSYPSSAGSPASPSWPCTAPSSCPLPSLASLFSHRSPTPSCRHGMSPPTT